MKLTAQVDEVLGDIAMYVKSDVFAMFDAGGAGWRTHHQKRSHKIKSAIRVLKPKIDQAAAEAPASLRKGRDSYLGLNQKMTLLIVQQLVGYSNRDMAYMLLLFSAATGVYLSYRTIERLRRDSAVYTALLRLRELLLGRAAANGSSVPD